MKKLVTFALVLCVAAGALLIWLKLSEDSTAPEISYSGTIIYTDGMTTEELLAGVIATDDVDGDVSDSLTVERVVANSENGTATVIYAAKDGSNNVAKSTRVLACEDGEEETEADTEEETETSAKAAVKTEPESESESESESGTESGESVSRTEQTEESETEESETEEQLSADAPRITLKQSRVTVKQGDEFEPTDYVDTITDDSDNKYELWQRIQVEGSYDTSITGIYQLVYSVTDTSGNQSNRETLLLIVEE